MFYITRLISLPLAPTALLIELALAGLLLRRRALLAVAVGLLAACLVLPFGAWAIRPLENRFPAVADFPAHVDGIVLLGSAIDDLTSQDRQTPTLNAAANAVTSFVILSRHYPDARLIFTGGSGDLQQGHAAEAPWTRQITTELGLPPERVTFEDKSRTTWENAVEVSRLVQPKPGEVWILLTTAAHMPRSMGAFRAAGWRMLPWPVGYRSRNRLDTWAASPSETLFLLDAAAHEWLGLLAYWLQGHSSALFPGP